MPSSVRAERSLCAQIAATATFKISISFTVSLYGGKRDLVTGLRTLSHLRVRSLTVREGNRE
jgi:hypothetical protein